MAIRRSNDGSGMVVMDITTTDGKAEKLGAIVSSNLDFNGTVPLSAWKYSPGTGGVVPSTGQTAISAAQSGARNFLESMQVSHATLGAAVELIIQDGSTAIWRGILQTAAADAGGFTLNFEPALAGSTNTALNYTFSAGTTGGVYLNAQGYVGV